MLEPPLQLQILLHPSAAGIQDQAGKLQGFPLLQILVDQLLPFLLVARRHPGVSVTREIDEVERAVDPVEIDRLRATRRVAGKRQPFLPGQGVNQAGLPDVTSPQKCDLRQPVAGEQRRPAGTDYKFGFQQACPGLRAGEPRRLAISLMRPRLFRRLHLDRRAAGGIGSATISRSSAIFSTSSIDSTKFSFMVFLMASGMSGRSFSFSLRDDRFQNAVAVRRHQLLFQAADRQHLAAQRDFAGHGHIAAHRNPGQRAADGGGQRDAGRGTVLGNGALRECECGRRGCGRNRAAARTGAPASGCSSWPPAPIPASRRPACR